MKARSLMVASCRLVRMPIRDIRDALGAHHAVMKDVVAGGVCNNANSGASSLHTVLVSFNDPDHRSNIYLAVSLLAERCITARIRCGNVHMSVGHRNL